VLLKNVPAQACDACGEVVFPQKSAEWIGDLVSDENQDVPTGQDVVLVFDYTVIHRGAAQPTPTEMPATTAGAPTAKATSATNVIFSDGFRG